MTEPKSREETKKKHLSITSKSFESIDSKKFHFINELTRSVTAKSTLKETLKNIMHILDSMFKPEVQIIHLLDSSTQKLESYFSDDRKKTEAKKSLLPIDEEAVRNAIESGKAVVMMKNNTRFIDKSKAIHMEGKIPISTLFATLSSKRGPVGVIEFINKAGSGIFTEKDCLLIGSVKDIIAIVIENHLLYEKALELSIIDYVSGRYNMKHFKKLLTIERERADRTLKPFSLVFFDLDFFRKINNTHGHLVGSSVLSRIGALLKKYLRKTDISARFGGDEFVIILPQTNKAKGKYVAERLRKIISNTEFYGKNNLIINITASFGIATYPTHSTDPEVLIDLSDKAMYMAKKDGRNGVKIYPD